MTITRPITHPNSPPPARNPERGLETITEAITRGITASRGDPSHAGPSLKGGPREGRGLSIRANVDLATYESIAAIGREHHATIETAAGVMLGLAVTHQQRVAERRDTRHAQTRDLNKHDATTQSSADQSDPVGGGSTPTRSQSSSQRTSQHPASCSPRVEDSSVRMTERVGNE